MSQKALSNYFAADEKPKRSTKKRSAENVAENADDKRVKEDGEDGASGGLTTEQKERIKKSEAAAKTKLKAKLGKKKAEKPEEEEEEKEEKAAMDTSSSSSSSSSSAPSVSSGNWKPPTEQEAKAFGYGRLEELLPPDWRTLLAGEFTKPYWKALKGMLETQEKSGETLFPPLHQTFNAFNHCPTLSSVKVVLIGQDPYINDGEAEGLCFSVPKGKKIPPSLVNIYKELSTDIPGFKTPSHGHLLQWADQGIFLLNAALTVKKKLSNCHANEWKPFTDAVVQILDQKCQGLVFVVWGGFAQKKVKKLSPKHYSVSGAHPSPLSQSKFFGCKHFSKVNELLTKLKKAPINWQIS